MPLTAILVIALTLRILSAWRLPNIIWADEIFQTVEPAHRLLTGTGMMSWEWVVGIRSWLIPGLIAPVLWLADALGLGPRGAVAAVAGLMLCLSLIPVAVAFRWGEQAKGLRGGVIVGGLAAIWVDLIFMAPHPLADVVATDAFTLALYLALVPPRSEADAPDPSSTGLRLALAGALFGLVCCLRMQLGPAILVAAGFACGGSWRRWRSLAVGGAVAVAAFGTLDWVTLGTPLQSVWLNFFFNIIGRVSNDFSTDPALFFLLGLSEVWGPVSVGVLLLAVFGRHRWPGLFWVAACILLTQSLVAHKEWRFIFPALPPLVILCGLQLTELLPRLEARLTRAANPGQAATALCLAACGAASLFVAEDKIYRLFWTHEREMILALDLLERQPGICGVGMLFTSNRADTPPSYSWLASLGSSASPPRIPQYAAIPDNHWRSAGSYNWAIIATGAQFPPHPFRLVRCFGNDSGQTGADAPQACVFARPGGCDPSVAVQPPINWPAYFLDDQRRIRRDRLKPRFLGMTPPLHFVSDRFTSPSRR